VKEETKGIREALRLLLANISTRVEEDESREESQRIDLRVLKDLLGVVGNWAGKGKDEVVQVLCREIGLAIAAMIKEPVTQILENRKLQITLEFSPKNGQKPQSKKKTSRSKRPSSRQTR